MPRPTPVIQQEIIDRLGFFPPFFAPALSDSTLLDSMWQQTVAYYLEGPLPSLFKERLAALVAQHCQADYCLVCHTCTLRPLGMTGEEVLHLLRDSRLELRAPLDVLAAETEELKAFPECGTLLEDALLHAALMLYLDRKNQECHVHLQRVLGRNSYHYLTFFLDYCKMCTEWVTAHPEIAYQADHRVKAELESLLEAAPSLRQVFAGLNIRV